MRFEVQSKELTELQLRISGIPKNISTRAILRTAVIPTKQLAKQLVPVGEFRPLTKRESSNALEYGRGGRTRGDIRIKMVSDKAGEMKALVGVSKAKNKVGWRSHFIEFGTERMTAKPFLTPAGDATKDTVQRRFSDMVNKRTDELLK